MNDCTKQIQKLIDQGKKSEAVMDLHARIWAPMYIKLFLNFMGFLRIIGLVQSQMVGVSVRNSEFTPVTAQ